MEDLMRANLRTTLTRSIAGVVAAATFAATMPLSPAAAAQTKPAGVSAPAAAVTDLSARKRHYRHHRHGNGAAALGAFAAIVGTIGAVAAAQDRRDYCYRYGCGYGYYGPRPYPYYGYYGYRRW
jgi:hypothetical protein